MTDPYNYSISERTLLVKTKNKLCDWITELYQDGGYWDWYVHLTFKDPIGLHRADTLWRRWTKELRKHSDLGEISYFRVMEWQRLRQGLNRHGVPHFHAVVGGVAGLRRLGWMDYWASIAGWARIQPYNPKRGAAAYMSKYLIKEAYGQADWAVDIPGDPLWRKMYQEKLNFS